MVVQQWVRRGITAPRVLEAMESISRERFVPSRLRHLAYADQALSIDCEQTISQPYIVGLMTQALELEGRERVLEIGTGSGYQTAVLASLCQAVVSVERHAELSRQAQLTLSEMGYGNVQFVVGDGTLGWPNGAPYDRILVAAAAQQIPPPLWEQLGDEGVIVIPLGDAKAQVLQAVQKVAGQPHFRQLSGCRFVPFVGAE